MENEKENNANGNPCCEDKWEKRIEEKFENWGKCDKKHKSHGAFIGGGFYCFGVIATAIYYIQQVEGFWLTILAVLKALVWPVFLIHKVFELLNM